MAENSKIEWTDHTFNPWVGCTKVSPACDHCYAEAWAKRTGQPALWGGMRRRTSVANWRKPLKWDAEAEKSGVRAKVFCASLADVFDNQIQCAWRSDLFDLIRLTPFLDWLLLTKRPQNIAKMIERDCVLGKLPDNVWLGTTVENQEEAERRIPHLLAVPAVVHFLSCEPLIGPVELWAWDGWEGALRGPGVIASGGVTRDVEGILEGYDDSYPGIDWVIAGGESGPRRRPMDLAWMRDLRDQCVAADVPFFGKQYDKVQELPPDLMVRQFPATRAAREG